MLRAPINTTEIEQVIDARAWQSFSRTASESLA